MLSKKMIPVPIIVSALLVSAIAMPIGKPTVASILIFGIPEDEINASFRSGAPSESIISVDVGNGWLKGTDFVNELNGKIVDSGRAYKVNAPFILVRHISPNEEPEFIQVNPGSISEVSMLPLRVIEVQKSSPIRLAYQSDGKWLCTYGNKSIPLGAWYGDYVLQNGQMVMIEGGKYSPRPLEVNAKVMVNGRIYETSIVYIYTFPFDPPAGL